MELLIWLLSIYLVGGAALVVADLVRYDAARQELAEAIGTFLGVSFFVVTFPYVLIRRARYRKKHQ